MLHKKKIGMWGTTNLMQVKGGSVVEASSQCKAYCYCTNAVSWSPMRYQIWWYTLMTKYFCSFRWTIKLRDMADENISHSIGSTAKDVDHTVQQNEHIMNKEKIWCNYEV